MSIDLRAKVKKVIVEHLGVDPDKLQDTASFTEVLGLDSLDAMDLLMAIDEAFGIRISPEKMEQIDTLDELVAVIAEQSGLPRH